MSEHITDQSATVMTVLVLQGGGAYGSYQAGAYQTLSSLGLEPDWVAATSIGAVNAAIIAGNEGRTRVTRLKEFWEMASAPAPWSPVGYTGVSAELARSTSALSVATFGVPGFFSPRIPPAPFWPIGSTEAQSYYDTEPLKKTLERLVDFDRINDLKTRLSLGAVSVTSGNLKYFDSYDFRRLGKKIGPEHVMASSAHPPGFPSIEIDGEHYWDGGIASNTPLDYVLDNESERDMKIFEVDVFTAQGALPTSLSEAAGREEEIRQSSRTRLNIDKNKQAREARSALRELIKKLPEDLKKDPSVEMLSKTAQENSVTVVHLNYRSKKNGPASGNYDFSHGSMIEHWEAGARDAYLSMSQPDRLPPATRGAMIVYEAAPDQDRLGFEQEAAVWVDNSSERRVTLLFATTRQKSADPEEIFSGERYDGTHYGKAKVHVPPDRRVGDLRLPFELKIFSLSLYKQTADPRIHFILEGCEIMPKDAWLSEINESRHEEALIFVHGFNVTFREGIYRCAQIAWDLGYKGIPILFSWASRGAIQDYLYDQTSARMGAQHFIHLLDDLYRTNVRKVHVLAHSMGNFLVLNALSTIPTTAAIGELVMAAPDIDRDEYAGMAPKVRLRTQGMTLYASGEDRALALSKRLSGNIFRAGDVPAAGPIVIKDIDTIDATALGDEIFGLNHGTFAKSKSILNDVKRLIADGKRPPDERLVELRGMPEGTTPSMWWQYII